MTRVSFPGPSWVMMAIKEPREAQISHVHTLNICHGKMRTKNQPKQPSFLGGGNPYLLDVQVKCPKSRCFLGELCEVASPKKERESFGNVWSGVECPVLLFYSLQLYSQVVNGGFSINMFIFQVQKRTQNKSIIQQRARKEAEIPMANILSSFPFSSKD